MAEYRQLNTREARAAFADRWVGIWAHDFDASWTVLYELLKLIEDDQLYTDPRRVGPGAAGDKTEHGDRPSYDSFEKYFKDRVRQPFATWSELERTYHYVTDYAPELFDLPYREAREQLRNVPVARETNAARGEKGFQRVYNINPLKGTSSEYGIRRLRRDRPELAAKVDVGELSVNAAMVEAGFRRPQITVFIDTAEAAITPLLKHYSKAELQSALEKVS